MLILNIIFFVAGAYLACGFVFAIIFVTMGVTKIDEGARGASVGFRVIIIPGSMVFWPLLLKKWIRSKPQPSSHD